MALTRNRVKEILSTAGVDGDSMDTAVQAIIDGHTATVDSLKEERDSYKAAASKLESAQKEVEALKKQAEGGDSYKGKYEELKAEFEGYKEEQAAKESNEQKKEAYSDLLKEAGVDSKRINSVLKVTDLNGLELGKDGKLKHADKLTESIKDDWADFIVTQGAKGAETSNPPAGKGGASKTREEIMAIKDAGERQQAIAENHELFGF